MSNISLPQISNRIRYEAFADLAQEINSSIDLDRMDEILRRRCKYIVDAIGYLFVFHINDEVVSFTLNLETKQFDIKGASFLSSHLERPQLFSKESEQDTISSAFFEQKPFIKSVLRIGHYDVNKGFSVYFASKNEYNAIDIKFIRLISEFLLSKVQNIRLAQKIRSQHSELVVAHNQLAIINDDLKGSLRYAKRIQQAITQEKKSLLKSFNNFVFHQPKDEVSGDFYFSHQVNGVYYLIVADCTGHGVPGAMISILCLQLLKEVFKTDEVLEPHEILQQVDESFRQSTSQNNHFIDDGMDVAVICIDPKQEQIHFSSAKRPLVLVQNNELKYIKGSRFSVGNWRGYGEKIFETKSFQYSSGDRLYAFTDGFTDQFGGARGKKLRISRMRKMIEETHALSIEKQGDYMERFLHQWMEDSFQVDDILLVGVEL